MVVWSVYGGFFFNFSNATTQKGVLAEIVLECMQ